MPDWHALHHAYGPADDVPRAIEELASADEDVHVEAFELVSSSLCHQGTLYTATAPAVPLLLAAARGTNMRARRCSCEILAAIAEASNADPERIRTTWAWRKEKFGEIYPRPTAELVEEEVSSVSATRAALRACTADLEALTKDGDEIVAQLASEMLTQLA